MRRSEARWTRRLVLLTALAGVAVACGYRTGLLVDTTDSGVDASAGAAGASGVTDAGADSDADARAPDGAPDVDNGPCHVARLTARWDISQLESGGSSASVQLAPITPDRQKYALVASVGPKHISGAYWLDAPVEPWGSAPDQPHLVATLWPSTGNMAIAAGDSGTYQLLADRVSGCPEGDGQAVTSCVLVSNRVPGVPSNVAFPSLAVDVAEPAAYRAAFLAEDAATPSNTLLGYEQAVVGATEYTPRRLLVRPLGGDEVSIAAACGDGVLPASATYAGDSVYIATATARPLGKCDSDLDVVGATRNVVVLRYTPSSKWLPFDPVMTAGAEPGYGVQVVADGDSVWALWVSRRTASADPRLTLVRIPPPDAKPADYYTGVTLTNEYGKPATPYGNPGVFAAAQLGASLAVVSTEDDNAPMRLRLYDRTEKLVGSLDIDALSQNMKSAAVAASPDGTELLVALGRVAEQPDEVPVELLRYTLCSALSP